MPSTSTRYSESTYRKTLPDLGIPVVPYKRTHKREFATEPHQPITIPAVTDEAFGPSKSLLVARDPKDNTTCLI